MRSTLMIGLVAACASLVAAAGEKDSGKAALYPELQEFVERRVGEFDQIPRERKAELGKVARYVTDRIKADQPARIVFICTHNSRRSHMGQIWAAAAASHYGVAPVESFSGGTEATAFNPRAVAAMERAGFQVRKLEEGKNPHYAVRFQETDRPLTCYSKVFSDAANPTKDFCAVMTCSQADRSCPSVEGSSLRVAVPFDDPKVADDTPDEAKKYDERCAQIGREILYLFSQVSL